MKESGIDWIGQIPEEWEISKIRYLVTTRSEKRITDSSVPYIGLENIESQTGKFVETGIQVDKSENIVVEIGDILFGKLRPYLRKYWRATFTSTASSEFLVFQSSELDMNFLYYAIQSDSFIEEVNTSTYGSKMPRASWEYIKNMKIAFPTSLVEQQKIADFLDKKIAQLDKVRSLLEEQIQKLNAYRASLIYETVTKGLDKTVHMKDSGIDWIGQVPQGWGVSRLKYYFDIYAGGDIDERNTVEEYSESHPYPVLSNSLENEGVLGYTNKYRFKKNCVTVTGRGDVGKAVYRNIKFYPVVRLLVCVPKSQVDCRFVTYWINSAIIEKNQTAVSQLTIQMLGELIFVNVPFLEQQKIADFLDKKTNQIDKLIQIKNQQIDNINKQRQTLIYDYVTGKKRA